MYFLSLEYYYTRGPLPNDEDRLLRLLDLPDSMLCTLRTVLSRHFKFDRSAQVWRHERADYEKQVVRDMLQRSRESGQRGAIKRWGLDPLHTPPISPPNGTPTWQKKIEEEDISTRKSKISEKWIKAGLSDRVKKLCKEAGFPRDRAQVNFEHFCTVAEAKGYKYANWDSALWRAIKDNWAKWRPKGSVM